MRGKGRHQGRTGEQVRTQVADSGRDVPLRLVGAAVSGGAGRQGTGVGVVEAKVVCVYLSLRAVPPYMWPLQCVHH